MGQECMFFARELQCWRRAGKDFSFVSSGVMSAGWLLCSLLWFFNSILFLLTCIINMHFILDIKCLEDPSVEAALLFIPY